MKEVKNSGSSRATHVHQGDRRLTTGFCASVISLAGSMDRRNYKRRLVMAPSSPYLVEVERLKARWLLVNV